MSLRAPGEYSVPPETRRVARAAFPRGNPYLRVADTLGPLFSSSEFVDLYSREGQPAEDPARLALVTIFQFAEGLSDRQAADAVRGRIDWKYALALPLEDAGFDASVLSEFRGRLLAGQAQRRLFDTLLAHLKAQGFVKARGRQRTDSTHVLAAIHVLNRLECVGETLRQALNTLAVVAPDWLRSWVPATWFERYGQRLQDYRLPKSKEERTALAEQIGADGRHLLATLDASTLPMPLACLRRLPAVATLRRVWTQQYYPSEPGEPVRWRTAADLPPAAELISSPYDPDARYSMKRETEWTGYKVHLTETCDEETPNLITDVATTPAPTIDHAETGAIQDRLAAHELLPKEHLVDTTYVTSDHLVRSRLKHGCTLLGPIAEDYSWQARQETGFAVAQFAIDWGAHRATCPTGRTSVIWTPGRSSLGHPIISIRFAHADCAPCPVRHKCVSTKRPRSLMVRHQPEFEALMAARRRQTTAEFRQQYAARAGIEGTISQGVHVCGMRRSRYRGLAKTALGHLFIATALNVIRLAAWLAEVPRSTTPRSALAALAPAAA
jgi:transposase